MKRLSAILMIVGFFTQIWVASAGVASAGQENHEAHHNHGSAIMIQDVQIRATTPNAGATAAYAHIHNHSAEDDRLIGASVTFAKKTEIHEMMLDGDVMKMRPLKDGIALPAGASVSMKNGAEHVMIMGLTNGIMLGETYLITFEFAKAGAITIEAEAIPLSGKSGKSHDHSTHKH